jgi:phage host-nuclease inhibitor protein Gam
MKYFWAFLVIIISFNLKAQHRQRVSDEKFSAHQVKKITASSENTDYIITGHNDTTVSVSITAITNTPKKMEELQKNFKVVTDLQNNLLRIETFTGDAKGNFLVEIYVPQNIALDISTQNSHVIIQKTYNDIQLTHHSQSIDLKEIRGGKININSKNGEITIKNSVGDIQLNTNKTIEAEILEGQLTCISGGHQNIILKKSIPTMLNTQNGNIKLKIPTNAQFDCRFTSDIPIKLELNNFQFEGSINLKTLTGKINQGNIPLKLTANKGGIWLSN